MQLSSMYSGGRVVVDLGQSNNHQSVTKRRGTAVSPSRSSSPPQEASHSPGKGASPSRRRPVSADRDGKVEDARPQYPAAAPTFPVLPVDADVGRGETTDSADADATACDDDRLAASDSEVRGTNVVVGVSAAARSASEGAILVGSSTPRAVGPGAVVTAREAPVTRDTEDQRSYPVSPSSRPGRSLPAPPGIERSRASAAPCPGPVPSRVSSESPSAGPPPAKKKISAKQLAADARAGSSSPLSGVAPTSISSTDTAHTRRSRGSSHGGLVNVDGDCVRTAGSAGSFAVASIADAPSDNQPRRDSAFVIPADAPNRGKSYVSQ